MVRYFLSVGYDPTILHADGNSSLHIAMRSLDPVILRAVSKNFSVNIKNKDGPSPVALAILFNNDAATFNNVILNDLLLAFPIVSFNDIGNKNYFLK